jgi:hypothetical protein
MRMTYKGYEKLLHKLYAHLQYDCDMIATELTEPGVPSAPGGQQLLEEEAALHEALHILDDLKAAIDEARDALTWEVAMLPPRPARASRPTPPKETV